MTAILFIFTVAALIHLIKQNKAVSARQRETEQAVNKLNMRSRKQANMYKQEIDRIQRRQREQEERQARLEREQRRQAEELSKMQFKLSQATADIEAGKTRLNQLYALLDIAEANRTAAMPGSRQDVTAQKQILSLENQIHSTEKRIAKAQYDRHQAQKGLAA